MYHLKFKIKHLKNKMKYYQKVLLFLIEMKQIFQNTNSIPTIQKSENDEPEDIRNIIHINKNNKNNYEEIDNIVTKMRNTILYSNKNPIAKEIINYKDLTSSSESSCDI